MRSKLFAPLVTGAFICAFVAVVWLTPLPAAQAPAPQAAPKAVGSRTWTVPRTADGHPDFQGLWTNATVTPLERPVGANEFLTPAEIEAAEKRGNRDEEADLDAERVARDESAPEAQEPTSNRRSRGTGGDAATGNYNAIWWQLGKKALGNNRSSIITGPTGRLPHTPETVKLLEANRQYAQLHPADGPEFRDNIERCLAWITSGPPMLPTFYNNTYRIFQTRDHVAIQVEMIHDVRLIAMNGRPHVNAAVQQWLGDSRGRWDGDTLVVETTNVNSKRNFIGGGSGRSGLAPNNQKMRVVERFTRTAPDTLLYQFTVDNPAVYSAPWSGEIPMRATTEPLYEYACHEGNYALVDILAGARADEKAQQSPSKEN